MKFYFIYRKYKYVNLLALDFNNLLQIYKNPQKLNDRVFGFNRNFITDYELCVGTVDLNYTDVEKIGNSLYAKLDNDDVRESLNFFQKIEFIN